MLNFFVSLYVPERVNRDIKSCITDAARFAVSIDNPNAKYVSNRDLGIEYLILQNRVLKNNAIHATYNTTETQCKNSYYVY